MSALIKNESNGGAGWGKKQPDASVIGLIDSKSDLFDKWHNLGYRAWVTGSKDAAVQGQ